VPILAELFDAASEYSQEEKLRIDVLRNSATKHGIECPPQRVICLVPQTGEMEKWRNPNSWLAGDIAGGYYKIAVEYREKI